MTRILRKLYSANKTKWYLLRIWSFIILEGYCLKDKVLNSPFHAGPGLPVSNLWLAFWFCCPRLLVTAWSLWPDIRGFGTLASANVGLYYYDKMVFSPSKSCLIVSEPIPGSNPVSTMWQQNAQHVTTE